MTSAAPSTPEITIGGRYEAIRLLGQGSFGRTFLARDLQDGRDVAIKQLRMDGEGDGWKRFELFEREAAVLGALRHQGIPAIYAHLRVPGARGEEAYLVMEYIEGESLAARIDRRDHLDPPRLLALLLGLLDILEYLHTRVPPVLHRDIKPSNVLVRPGGGPVLVDFGAVRNIFKRGDEGGSTIVGTSGYMPFEQYMGQASPASDLYALGATFLHLITGRPPSDFVAPDGKLAVPTDLPGGEPLRSLLARLVAADPADRYPDAAAVRDALLTAAVTPAPTQALAPRAPSFAALALDDPGARDRLRRQLSRSPVRMMYPNLKPSQPVPTGHYLGYLALGLLSFGLLFVICYFQHRDRASRMDQFFRAGTPATARLLGCDHRGNWTYEFTADGVTHRGVDPVHESISPRLHAGDVVRILYLPGSHDSVIIETA